MELQAMDPALLPLQYTHTIAGYNPYNRRTGVDHIVANIPLSFTFHYLLHRGTTGLVDHP
eukprot:scaffold58322_cov67-Phaeocystis_antarctica.AAC.5